LLPSCSRNYPSLTAFYCELIHKGIAGNTGIPIKIHLEQAAKNFRAAVAALGSGDEWLSELRRIFEFAARPDRTLYRGERQTRKGSQRFPGGDRLDGA